MLVSVDFMRKMDNLDPVIKDVLYSLIIEIEKSREQSVTKNEFRELHNIVKELADAQKRTEVKVEELADAQKRTEVKIEELADAQKRTEVKVEELADAQKRTEVKIEELVEAQKELTEAQKRTEEELRTLGKAVKNLQKEVGGISHTIGFTIEDRAYKALPALLMKDCAIEVKDRLIRKFLICSDGREEEVNIYGMAKTHDGRDICIIGEGKAHVGEKDVINLLKRIKRLEHEIKYEIYPLMIGYSIRPSVEKLLKEKGITYYFSYDF